MNVADALIRAARADNLPESLTRAADGSSGDAAELAVVLEELHDHLPVDATRREHERMRIFDVRRRPAHALALADDARAGGEPAALHEQGRDRPEHVR